MPKAESLWSASEISLLTSKYSSLSAGELLAILPGRSIQAIRKKARKIGLHVPPEIEFKNRSEVRSGEKCCSWRGGIRRTAKGYIQRMCKTHPRADGSGYVFEHILVWEAKTGLPVPPGFVIHHLDGNKQNNDISNLCMMKSEFHTAYHNKLKKEARKC